MANIDTRALYLGLILIVAIERLLEQKIAARHAQRLRERGGFEVGSEHYPWMVTLHTAFLIACPLEIYLADRPWLPALGGAMVLVVAATMALRYWVIATLGDRWTTRIFVVPGEGRRRGGPYRWLRHPNYVAVAVELAALPLVHTAWLTAILFTLLNARMLSVRIRAEDRALDANEGGS